MTTLYYSPNYIRPIVTICLAKYFKTDFNIVDIATVPEEFAREFPLKKCPALVNKDTGLYLTESIAICHYIINTYCKDKNERENLLGKTILEQAEILKWQSLSVSDFLNRIFDFLAPLLGFIPYNAESNKKAEAESNVVLGIYENQLAKTKFLAGDHITLADLCAAGSFFFGFNFAFDEAWRKQNPNITRWYLETIKSSYISDFFKDKPLAQAFPQPPK